MFKINEEKLWEILEKTYFILKILTIVLIITAIGVIIYEFWCLNQSAIPDPKMATYVGKTIQVNITI